MLYSNFCLRKPNGGAVGGNAQIKGAVNIMRSERKHNLIILFFLTCLQRKPYQNKFTRLSLFTFSSLIEAPGYNT